MTLKCKIWEDGSVLFDNYSTRVFLMPLQVKHLVNWLNLHCEDLQNKNHIPIAINDTLEMITNSVNGFTMINTNRDVFLCNHEDLMKIKKWINLHRQTIGCQEVLE